MRVLFVAMKYEYGDPELGLSFEETNFHDALRHMRGIQVSHFDFMEEMRRNGQQAMNERLYETYRREKPDLMFFFLLEDQIFKETIKRISDEGRTITFNWFADDHWRFDNYSRFWAPSFHYVSTTASSALPKYQKIGYKNVIKTQWGCNHFMYRKLNLPPRYDMTFVGQPHGDRRETVAKLRAAGLHVDTFGYGWEVGRVSQEEMIRIFNQSRINLNLSNASFLQPKSKILLSFVKFWKYPKFVLHPRLILPKIWMTKVALSSSSEQKQKERAVVVGQQIKGRNFEIPGCGGFQLSGRADNLEEYFVPDKEIVIFETMVELVDKTKYYLAHEEVRKKIAEAGYRRVLAEHTYEKRFNEVFREMGLPK